MEYTLFVSNLFTPSNFADWARPDGLKIGIANNLLTFIQSVNVHQKPIYLTAENELIIFNEADQRNIVLNASNFLNIQQQVARPNIQLVTSFLFMTQLARTVLWEQVLQQIVFEQGVDFSDGISNGLILNQTVTVNFVKNLTVGNTLAMQSAAAMYKENNPDTVICGS